MKKRLIALPLLACVSVCNAHTTIASNNCDGYDRDVQAELNQLKAATHLSLERTSNFANKIDLSSVYLLTLSPQDTIRLRAEPHRLSLDDGSFAGLFAFTVPQDGKYRISASDEVWIDVVHEQTTPEVLSSTAFSGQFECPTLRKLVEFDLQKDLPYILQLSGATAAQLKILINPIAP